MASGPLKIEKGTCPVLILATHRHTTESVGYVLVWGIMDCVRYQTSGSACLSICPFGFVHGIYVVHHLVGTGLHCA